MKRRFMVKVTETYESFAVVEADNPGDAEWIVEELADAGGIDGVNMKGTLKSGGYDRHVACLEPTAQPVTVTKRERRKREDKQVRRAVARG